MGNHISTPAAPDTGWFIPVSARQLTNAGAIDTHREPIVMSVYCAWCRAHLHGPDVGYAHHTVSHGICGPCAAAMKGQGA